MKKKRVLAMLLAISLIIPNVNVRADNPDDGMPGDATVISSEEGTTEEEKTTEKEESEGASFTTPIEDVDTTLIDFSSRELLVGTDDPSIFTWDTEVISEYNGIYLTRYESEEVTKNAYTYYYDKADFVDANVVFAVQDNEETEDENISQLNEGDDAISNLNDMDKSQELPTGTIAVIDTGSDDSDNVIEAVSVIGDTSKTGVVERFTRAASSLVVRRAFSCRQRRMSRSTASRTNSFISQNNFLCGRLLSGHFFYWLPIFLQI